MIDFLALQWQIFQAKPISPSLILTLLAIPGLIWFRRIAAYLLLTVGFGGLAITWFVFDYLHQLWWSMALTHTPMLLAGIWLMEKTRIEEERNLNE